MTPLTTPTHQEEYACTQARVMGTMEEWGHADDRVIQRQYSEKVCMSCAWFTYGIDAHCHTCVGCALMEALLEQGQHLTGAAIRNPRTNWEQVPLSQHEKAGCSSPRNPASTQIKSF